jgi:hypothetical protein
LISFVRAPCNGLVRHYLAMPPELHLHPDRLRAHAVVAAGLSEALLDAVRGAPLLDVSERLCAQVRAAAWELGELSSALIRAAAGATAADDDVARVFGRLYP